MALAEAANMKEVVIPPGRVYHLSVRAFFVQAQERREEI
jgi:hypothetical protein